MSLNRAGAAATLTHDGLLEFSPEGMGGNDAEIAADVGDNLADRAMANLFGNLLLCGQVREQRVVVGIAWVGAAGGVGSCDVGSVASEGGWCEERAVVLERRGGQRCGALGFECGAARQAAGDAGEDQSDVGGAELSALYGGVVAEAVLAKGGGEEGAAVDESLWTRLMRAPVRLWLEGRY